MCRGGGVALIDEQPRPVGAGLSRNLGSASAPGEKVEAEIDAMISRRHDRRVLEEGERVLAEAWKASERRQEAERLLEEGRSRLAWANHLRGVYAARKEEYERLVETLEGTQRKETP